jgi:hypothetical protein
LIRLVWLEWSRTPGSLLLYYSVRLDLPPFFAAAGYYLQDASVLKVTFEKLSDELSVPFLLPEALDPKGLPDLLGDADGQVDPSGHVELLLASSAAGSGHRVLLGRQRIMKAGAENGQAIFQLSYKVN